MHFVKSKTPKAVLKATWKRPGLLIDSSLWEPWINQKVNKKLGVGGVLVHILVLVLGLGISPSLVLFLFSLIIKFSIDMLPIITNKSKRKMNKMKKYCTKCIRCQCHRTSCHQQVSKQWVCHLCASFPQQAKHSW